MFGADEWLYVLEGTLAIANPETGEVERIATGGSVFFRKDTWHHAFACDGEPLKVVEFFSPPPSTGSSGAYARTRPYLEESRYADDALLGNARAAARRARARCTRCARPTSCGAATSARWSASRARPST